MSEEYLSKHGLDTFWAKIKTWIASAVTTNSPSTSKTVTGFSEGKVTYGDIQISESQVTNLTTHLGEKAPLVSPALDGTPTAPTAATGTDTTQIATTAFVNAEIAEKMRESDAMIYKGAISGGSSGTYGALTPAADKGHTYKVSVAGKLDGQDVRVGDLIVCNTDNTAAATANNYATVWANWDYFPANEDGVVFGPSSAVDARIAVFDGTTGKLIEDGGVTVADLQKSTVTTQNNYTNPGSTATALSTLFGKIWNFIGRLRTSWQTTPDDTHFPSEKLVKDSLDGKQDKPSSATENNIATFNASKSTKDSGKAFLPSTSTWDGTSDAKVPTAKSVETRIGTLLTNPNLGQIYSATTSLTDSTFAVTASGYELKEYGIVAVKFSASVPADAKMNINGKGAKDIYYRGSAIGENVIAKNDTATFMYDGTRYHLLSIDSVENEVRMYDSIMANPQQTTAATRYYKFAEITSTTSNNLELSCDFMLGDRTKIATGKIDINVDNTDTYWGSTPAPFNTFKVRYITNSGIAGLSLYATASRTSSSPKTLTVELWAAINGSYKSLTIAQRFSKQVSVTVGDANKWSWITRPTGTDTAPTAPTGGIMATAAPSSVAVLPEYGTAVGSAAIPTYVDTDGTVKQCTNDFIHTAGFTNWALGQGYVSSSGSAGSGTYSITAASYALKDGGIIAVKFTQDVAANSKMNVNGKGAKDIYYNGTNITAGVIKSGDIATFMYDGTRYQLLSCDRVFKAAVVSMATAGTLGTSEVLQYTKADGSTATAMTAVTDAYIAGLS